MLDVGISIDSDTGRGTGRTTAQALSLLGEALVNPGRHFYAIDHSLAGVEADKMLVIKAMNIAERLGLKGFRFNIKNNTVILSLSTKQHNGNKDSI